MKKRIAMSLLLLAMPLLLASCGDSSSVKSTTSSQTPSTDTSAPTSTGASSTAKGKVGQITINTPSNGKYVLTNVD
ncbi:MAG: hypothetical protein LKJ88_00140 [Bacilli bacterium]|nr:hypothetical protein [Bacilli bacterium]